MDESRKKRMVDALQAKNLKPCPRCGNANFEFVGESIVNLQTQQGILTIGGPGVPVALVACNNCGYLSHHALGVLGLLKEAK